ncbi:MAG: double zinc ribbon domain-containing protein [Streptosporangiaceae bacterium]
MTDSNWYAFLRLSPTAREDEIQSAVERLSRQASALAATAPERSQSLRETARAIKRDLLSGPESRRRYDACLPLRLPSHGRPAAAHLPPAPGPAPPAPVPPEPVPYGFTGAGSRLARFLRTGWTCPACGNGGVPSDKFCTKCGTPIQPIRPEASGPEHAPRPRPACAACAYPLGPADAFCSRCGSRRA